MDLLERFRDALPRVVDDIRTLVTCESPSDDLAALAASAKLTAELGTAYLGSEPEQIVLDGRPHLRWRLGDGPRRVLVLCHHDTVWPIGTLDNHPFAVADEVLRGPGCFDMKTGTVMAFHAIAALAETDGITVLVTGDEELGSPSSRQLIEEEARGCVAALVLESAGAAGALKTERKGVSLYQVTAVGRAAHAGLEPEKGVNASLELAFQLSAVAALGAPERGTTVTPTALQAGTTTNTVPAQGRFAVDVRARTVVEQQRVDTAIRALRPHLPGAELHVTGGPNRPPLEAVSSAELFERVCRLAAGQGLAEPAQVSVGGASDGNFTAGIGVPTLDGLGASGGGAHADDEHVLVDELPGRIALLAALLADLLTSALPDPAGAR
ncbi:MAG TPA: M20 family metallopeptidase [Flexivirga sp.]|uniref:M20 family metallopeptidase n=1 Tax=Flexivirga sp. TaxID=1962927 RepID=UPI002D17857A|nr:M20 family metallopeptidase [Flexivirga sp.]HWC24421.1 M20 family metallopeptidase [Flexivirga sp.]